jgi:hypothetical protein
MKRSLFCAGLVAFLLAGLGCHQCGDRPRLFGRFRDNDDDDRPRRFSDRALDRDRDRECCDPSRPVARPSSGSFGQPIMGNPVGIGGEIPYTGSIGSPIYPGGGGTPIYPGTPTRSDELPPPGGYQPIPNPGLPSSPYATPRPTDFGRLIQPGK